MLFGMLPEAKSKCVLYMAAACKGHDTSSVTSGANNETDKAVSHSGSSGSFVLKEGDFLLRPPSLTLAWASWKI